MTIAWVFPGQGSQKLGMANSLLDLPGSRDRFELASQILGRDLWKICCGEGIPNEEIYDLNDTCLLYTSPSPRDQRGSRMPSSA